MKTKPRLLACLSFLCMLTACSEHRVDTFPEWCEQITGVDLYKKYAPFWAVFRSISFDAEAIRDDFVRGMNLLHMEKVQGRIDKMAWREGTEFHLVNLSSLMVIEPEEVIGQWKVGIGKAKIYQSDDKTDICLYGTVTSMFDSMHIHSMKTDALGIKWTDDVTVIDTERRKRLKNPL